MTTSPSVAVALLLALSTAALAFPEPREEDARHHLSYKLDSTEDLECYPGDGTSETPICECNGSEVALGDECDDCRGWYKRREVFCENNATLCYNGPMDAMFHHKLPICAEGQCENSAGLSNVRAVVNDVAHDQGTGEPYRCEDGEEPLCVCFLNAIACSEATDSEPNCANRAYQFYYCEDGSDVAFRAAEHEISSEDLLCYPGDGTSETPICECDGDEVSIGDRCDDCLDSDDDHDVFCEDTAVLCYDGPGYYPYLPRCAEGQCENPQTHIMAIVNEVIIDQGTKIPNACEDGEDPLCVCLLNAIECSEAADLEPNCANRAYQFYFCEDESEVTFGLDEDLSVITML